MVTRIADERARLLAHLGNLKIRVSLLGNHPIFDQEDDTLCALCKPVIERELRARVSQLEKDLAALGVEVG